MKGMLFFYLLCLTMFSACQESNRKQQPSHHNLDLHPRYLLVDSIRSVANCVGPNGAFNTEVQVNRDGYVYFQQTYSYREGRHETVVDAMGNGYHLNENGEPKDTISDEVRFVIQSHAFHFVSIDPTFIFPECTATPSSESMPDRKIEFDCTDFLGNSGSVLLNGEMRKIEQIKITNPMKIEEEIVVLNEDWIETTFGHFFRELTIIQGGSDTFKYYFDTLEINQVNIDLNKEK